MNNAKALPYIIARFIEAKNCNFFMFDFTNDKIEIITNVAEYVNAIKLLLSIILYNAMFNIE